MVNNRMTEGVGKKIVEALKKQTDVEISPYDSVEPTAQVDTPISFNESIPEFEFIQDEAPAPTVHHEELEKPYIEPAATSMNLNFDIPKFDQPLPKSSNTMNFTQTASVINENYTNEFEEFELPQNVEVLRGLITKLPPNVSKQTGAQIIKQTMEALGISMKNVLQEAHQVQESLNNSARECQNNILEYKRQIEVLEKQTHKFNRQYAQLNDIISLFIQTGN